MRLLLAATALTPIALTLASTALHAQTTIGNARTAPVRTSTVNGGAPSDVRITAAGSVKVTSGTAVTVDSDNNVRNEGTVQITGANNATGIGAVAGVSSTITNTGKITLDENYTPTDTDKDGDVDGPFAQGSGRIGIHLAPGGIFTGNVVNSGTILVEGNNSAGIRIDSGLDGSLSNTGTVNLLGNGGYGIRAGDVSGNVTLRGTVSVVGQDSVGVALDGALVGALVVQGTIRSTGYRNTTAPADTSKLDADDLLQGGPALRVSGNVGGGILFDVPPPNNSTTDDDEDDDGIKDAEEGSASVASYGAAPAVRIGSQTADIAIGAVSGTAAGGHGIVVKGSILGSGVYKDVDASGLVIGGLGGDVAVAGGLAVSGSITARSKDRNAVAVHVGDGASVPAIRNSGTIGASGGGTEGSEVAAVRIEEGGSTASLHNSGKINASLNGQKGAATAILDRSGTLALVENSGAIAATGADAASGRAVAIDLRANGAGATVRQTLVADGKTAPSIAGNILFGAGDDLLDIADGTVAGAVRFGAGDDSMKLGGDASFTGTADFGGGGGSLNLGGTSSFNGTLLGGDGLAVTVAGGALNLANEGTVALGSLSVGAQGSIAVNVDGDAGTHTFYDVAGAASFAQGSSVVVRLNSISDAEGEYVILRADDLTGAPGLGTASTALPYLFVSSLSADHAAGELELSIRRKTAAELELNGSESSAYAAIFNALGEDEGIGDAFLAINDGETLRRSIRQMLPDHAGGAFETVTQGSRATARFLTDPRAPMLDMGGWGFFLQQVAWGSSKDLGDTAAYDISGWGASIGGEIEAGGAGAFGASLSYLLGSDADGGTDNEVRTSHYEAALYWRGGWGGFNAHGRASYGRVGFSGTRHFTGATAAGAVQREATGSWSGNLFSAGAGLSYEVRAGRLTVRPLASIDYYKLSEDGYSETGGGGGFNLVVAGRSSDELAANGTLSLGYDFAGVDPAGGFFRLELEGGRRQILSGELGATVANFDGGDAFTLLRPSVRAAGSESFACWREERRSGSAASSTPRSSRGRRRSRSASASTPASRAVRAGAPSLGPTARKRVLQHRLTPAWEAARGPPMLNLNGIIVRLGGHTILDGASAALPPGARVGMVGRNGAGKTTLMRVVTGQIDPDEGAVEMPKNARIGYIAQDAPSGSGTPLEAVLAADVERSRLLDEAERTTEPHRLAEAHERLNAIDAHAAPARAAKILVGLGFDEAAQQRPLDSFSGGWRMRVALAALLFSQPDLLLLDEPSNHLDLEATLWLENFLRSYRATMLIVSHERDLLNNVADHILHLERGRTTLYQGGYNAFERQRRERQAQAEAMREKQLAQRAKLQSFVDRWRAKAHTARQAQSRMKALARMEPVAAAVEDPSLSFDFPSPHEVKPPLVMLDGAAVGYEPGKPVLSRLNLRIDPDDRIALLGRNGNGKTTLARLLAAQLPPMEGEMNAPGKLRVGYFTQYQVEELDRGDTPLQHMSRLMPDAPPKAVRAQLGRFGFSGEKATMEVAKMSGGERARLALALITRDAPHLLILDEPTNHLDVDAREALVQALNDYDGAVVVVSHDRHMLELTADRLLLVDGGTAREFSGSLDDYTDLVLGRTGDADRAEPAAKESRKDARRAAAEARERSQALRKRVKAAEAQVAKLEARRTELDRAMFDPASAAPADAGRTMTELMKLRAEVAAKLEQAEAHWLETCEAIEQAEAA